DEALRLKVVADLLPHCLKVDNRHDRIETRNRLTEDILEFARRSFPTNVEGRRADRGRLPAGQEHVRLDLLCNSEVFRVGRKAHHLDTSFRLERNAPTDDICAHTEALCETLCNDSDARGVRGVGVAKVTAGEQSDAQRLKEARADEIEVGSDARIVSGQAHAEGYSSARK